MSDFNIQVAEPLKVQAAIPRIAIYTAIMSLVAVVMYILGPALIVNPFNSLFTAALAIILPIVLGNQERKANYTGGYMEYGTAWQLLMLFTVASTLAGLIIQVLWFSVIDPGMPEALAAAAADNAVKMAETFANGNDTGIDRDAIEAETLKGFVLSPINMAKTLGMGLFGGALFNALIALAVRKKVPVVQ